MSFNTIGGGKAINVVPDECTVGIDIRTAPPQKHTTVVSDIEQIFAKLKQKDPKFKAEIAIARDIEALDTDNNCDFVKDFCCCLKIKDTKSVGFCTDGPFLTPLEAPIIIFGPGKPEICHKPDEYIDIADVEKAIEDYKSIISRFLL